MEEDKELLGLLLAHDESAAAEIEKEYGELIRRIAGNILDDPRDIEECVNDTLYSLWASMPDEKPGSLRAYVARVARNTALNRNAQLRSGKRWAGKPELALHELSESLASRGDDPFQAVSCRELMDEIVAFIKTRSSDVQTAFMARYFFYEDIEEIARRLGIKPNTVYYKLRKARKELKQYLIERDMYYE